MMIADIERASMESMLEDLGKVVNDEKVLRKVQALVGVMDI
jgi:hypothetical protein